MEIISNKNLEKSKKEIKNQKEKPIIVEAQDDEYNRKILEYGKFDILLFPDTEKRKDSLRQLDSGFNHVLGKIATKNKISIGFSLEKIATLSLTEKSVALARIKQNINICKKTKTQITFIGNQKLGYHLLLSLGASTSQIKKSTSF